MKDNAEGRREHSVLIKRRAGVTGPVGQREMSGPKSRWIKLFSRSTSNRLIADEMTLVQALSTEMKRCGRSGKRFAFVLLQSSQFHGPEGRGVVNHISRTLVPLLRDSDLVGLYDGGTALGILFTELGREEAVSSILTARIREALAQSMNHAVLAEINMVCHVSAGMARDNLQNQNGRPVPGTEGTVRAQASPQSAS